MSQMSRQILLTSLASRGVPKYVLCGGNDLMYQTNILLLNKMALLIPSKRMFSEMLESFGSLGQRVDLSIQRWVYRKVQG
jgi:hypothetical protein